MVDNTDFFTRLETDKRARVAEAEVALLKARLAVLEGRVQSVDDEKKGNPPTDDEETGDADEPGIDPKTGKPRRKKVKAEEEDEACDEPKTEDQEEATAKATALLVVNCYRHSLKAPGTVIRIGKSPQPRDRDPTSVKHPPRDPRGQRCNRRRQGRFLCTVASFRNPPSPKVFRKT